MLDVAHVLDPRTGIVTAHNVLPLRVGRHRVWSVGAQLECEHKPADGEQVALPTCQTGACSLSRTGAVIRTAGESVERAALHGGPHELSTYADAGDSALAFFGPELSLGADPGDRVLRWYRGRRIRDDRDVLVPAGLVDYPAHRDDRVGFDPGPSGAASGVSYAAALKSALLETLERDAVIVTWARQARLRRLDIDALLSAAPEDPPWSLLASMVSVARDAGLVPVFAEVPTAVPSAICVVGGMRAPVDGREVLCLGAKASDHVGRALLGAFEESFQLYFGLAGHDDLRPHDESIPSLVTGDAERVRFLTSIEGVGSLHDWLAEPREPLERALAEEVDVDRLLAEMMLDGLDPVVVDLTGRLPDQLRRRGWSVVKVVPVGYQPLRIDERHRFGWSHRRLATLDERIGGRARIPPGRMSHLPHPLP